MAYLVLIRHGESLWNEKGLWTGWTDIELSEKGKEEAKHAANLLKQFTFNYAFTSKLTRAKQTYEIIKKELSLNPTEQESDALNERDYGDYTGKNKWEIQKQVGEEEFQKIRRGFTTPIPSGETLEDVYHRVVPYFKSEIEPLLKENHNVLVVAHGNSIRALAKYIENISDDDISNLELKTAEAWVYTFNNGVLEGKQSLQ